MNSLVKYIALITTAIWLTSSQSHCDCLFWLRRKMKTDFQPIYFVQTGKIYEPASPHLIRNKHYIQLEDKQILVITCPQPNPNSSTKKGYYEENIRLICKKDELVPTDGTKSYLSKTNPDTHQCKLPTEFAEKEIQSKKETKKYCNHREKLYEAGVYVNFKSKGKWRSAIGEYIVTPKMQFKSYLDWYPLYRICKHGMNKSAHAIHTIDGQKLVHRQTKRIPYAEMIPWKEYEENREMKYYDCEKKNLWFIPLVSSSYMPLLAWKHAVYQPHNLALMWNQVSCAWNSIENVVLRAALRLAAQLQVYTGYNELMNTGSIMKQIFKLKPSYSEIPQYFWKLIYRADTKEGIVIVLHNHPYLDENDDHTICTNICKQYGWKVANAVLGMGEVYCCEVKEIAAKIKYFEELAKLVDVENVLKMPPPQSK